MVTPGLLACEIEGNGTVRWASGGAGLPWPASSILGRRIGDVFPEGAARELGAYLAASATGATARLLAFDGVDGRAYEAWVVASEAGRAFAVVRDVTRERLDMMEAAADRAFLRQVLDLDPSLIFAKDRTGRFTFANLAVAAIYGTTPSGLVGKTDADFNANAEEVERFRRDDLHVMDALEPKRIAEEPVSSPGGGTRWFQTIKIPIVGPDGRADAVLGVASEITTRKEVERDLELRTERLIRQQTALRDLALGEDADLAGALRRILATAAATLGVERAGVWLLSSDGTALRTDTVFDRGAILAERPLLFEVRDHGAYFDALLTDRSIAAHDARTDPRTRSFAKRYLEPEGLGAMLDVPIRSHGALLGVVCHEHRGGPRPFTIEEEDFAASIADFVALALSAAKRRSLEDQLRQAQKMEAVGLLAGGIAHDFNNLLGIIAGYAGLAAGKLEPGHPAAAHVRTITESCLRAGELVRKILTFSRGQVLQIEAIDFGALLADFSTLLRRILGEDIEVRVEIPSAPLSVRADRTQLEQILLNLCTNARQAMPRGGALTLAATAVELTSAEFDGEPGMRPGPHVRLSVEDTGHGIDAATLTRLWEPFFTTKADGTGLGLSMVYGIVKQHGGMVRATSRVGHGSRFHVYLPLDAGTAAKAAPPPLARTLGRGETILVVEDEALIRELLDESLRELGYEVIVAADGEEAVRLFEAHQASIDLVLLDVVMPKLSGPEALTRMSAIRPGVKALFVSGHAPEVTRLEEVLKSSGRGFLPKPFVLEALAAKVRQVLEGA